MKTALRKPLIQILILLAMVEAFYFLGQKKILSASPLGIKTGSSPGPSTGAKKNSLPALTANEAKEQFLDALAGKFTARFPDMIGARIAIVFGTNLKDIPSLIVMLDSLPSGADRDLLINMLMGRLEKENPNAVPPLLASLAASLPDSPQRDEMILASIRSLANNNPQKALSELANLPQGSLAQNAYMTAFAIMVRNNPANALAALNDLPAGPERNSAMKGVGDAGVYSSDPKAVLDWLSRLPPEEAPVLNEALMNLSSAHKIGLAAEYIDNIQDPSERNDVIVQIAGSWGAEPEKNPAAALDWLNQAATGDTYTQAATRFFASLANKDPATAASLLGKETDPAVLETAIENIANGWGKTDPQAALTWAQALPDAVGTNAVNSIVAGWSKSDPMAAAAYVHSSPDPSAFLSDDPAIAQSLAVADPPAALNFADTMPDGEGKNQVLNNVLMTFAKTDFPTAWTDAAALPAVDNPIGIMTNLVGVLASKDPAQAAGLIAQFPVGTAQDNVTSTVAAIWVSLDPQAFTVWLTYLPPGDVRDTAIAQLADSSQAAKNPTGVLEWVNTVSNPQTKAVLLQQLAPAQIAEP